MGELKKENTSLRKSPNDFCKAEVLKIKKDLPENLRELIYEKFPEYNTSKGVALINNVLSGRSADLRLTEILKSFAFINTQVTQTEIPN